MHSIKLTLLILLGIIFTLFGVYLLVVAYESRDPFSFIISFFASNLVILISLVLTLGFVLRLVRHLRAGEDIPTSPSENS